MTTETILKRSDVPEDLTWDLTKIFATEADWEATFAEVEGLLPKIESYKGRMRRSGRLLLEALTLRDEISQKLSKLYVYARMNSDVDTTVSHYQELFGRIQDLNGKVSAASSYMSPELLSIKPERLSDWYGKVKGLDLYKQELEELGRERDHIRSPEVEQVLADASQIYAGPGNIHTMFDNADLRFPDVEDENGKMAKLTHGNWGSKWLDNPNRDARRRRPTKRCSVPSANGATL